MNSDRVLKTFPEALGRRRIETVEVNDYLLEFLLRGVVAFHLPGRTKSSPNKSLVSLGKMRENIPLLVELTSLDDGVLSETGPDRLPKSLGAVQHKKITSIGW